MPSNQRSLVHRVFGGISVLVFYFIIVSISFTPVETSNEVIPAKPERELQAFRPSEKEFNKKFVKDMKTVRRILLGKHKLVQYLGDRYSGRRRDFINRLLGEMEQGIMQKATSLELFMQNLTITAIKARLQHRLSELQEKSIEAHEDFEELLSIEAAEEAQNKTSKTSNLTKVGQLVGLMDNELGKVISQIKHELSYNNTWSQARSRAKQDNSSTVETVIKVEENRGHVIHEGAGIVSTLIDHDNNKYVLAMPHDSSIHYEDKNLVVDIIAIVCTAFVFGVISNTLRLPLFFGYITAGTILSPMELGILRNLVQIETLSQFGVYLMLFLLGVQFSLERLRQMWKTAVMGAILYMSIVIGLSWGAMMILYSGQYGPGGVVLGFCFTLSSTAVALNSLSDDDIQSSHGEVLLGVLVVQDVCLGLMIAVIPLLDQWEPHSGYVVVSQLLLSLILLCVASLTLGGPLVTMIFDKLSGQQELLLLAILSSCFSVMYVSELLGLSMEVGSFCIGLSFSVAEEYQQEVRTVVRPLQDLFVCLFFTSIGFHIYPSFLVKEIVPLVAITLLIVSMKYMIGYTVFHFCCRLPPYQASIISLGLSQLSEFSFVIAAHGKAVGIISNELYFFLLGITSLSLTTTPVLWKLHDNQSAHVS
eukprot:TRINITY_DN13920_c0_g1_i1.p1 TRINITY_DN13920_c0_g1~~TRINITY_DN13920_c0_g1_i1.p1  ORF type:complete len:647 (+),score=98.17 TRINITY_DN13920_c0_g1_i1:68-2008(+)